MKKQLIFLFSTLLMISIVSNNQKNNQDTNKQTNKKISIAFPSPEGDFS